MEVLINQATRCWRREVIDHCFNAIEAEVIKTIPLSTHAQRDSLVWPFTPNGQYTVNSGYRFLAKESNEFQLPHQSVPHPPVCWKKLWKLNVPNKIKNFAWHSCREALPTKANLCRRKITVDAICDRCKVRMEDCSHALFFCSSVQEVWTADQQWQWLSTLSGKTAGEIFNHALEEDKDPSLLAYTAWPLWNRRNKCRTNEPQYPLNQVMQFAKERRKEFQTAQSTFPKQMHKKHTRWKPPEAGHFKVNYDRAIFKEQGKAGIGVVIRNSDGAVLASLSQQIPLPTTVAQVEALAARRAAEFSLEIGIDQVIIEGDSEVIYKDLIDPGPSLALHGHLICDILQFANVFSLCTFNTVGRTGN